MVRKKPTKKEIETVVSNLINHVKFLEQKLNAVDNLFGLYLEWRKEKDTFNKFVQDKVAKHNSKTLEDYNEKTGDSK